MAEVQIVGVLSDFQSIRVNRLICRITLKDVEMNYHLYVDRRTADTIDLLLNQRPFKALRKFPLETATLWYAGYIEFARPEAAPLPEPPWTNVHALYLEHRYGKSRRKYRLDAPAEVIQQFQWITSLKAHDFRLGYPLIEA